MPILVGRNRKENEELSLRVAKPADVWMHVRDSPGAHVILQLSQVSPYISLYLHVILQLSQACAHAHAHVTCACHV